MKLGRISLLCFIICFFCLRIYSQIPNNTWRDHLPYRHAKYLAESDHRIFCVTSDGSLFSLNTSDNSLQKYSKVTGLSDSDISAIGYSEQAKIFVIGYENGNIDLVKGDSIINIPDIKRKSIMGKKSINKIFFINQYAYLACGFGIVICDLGKREFKDTYFIGQGGTQLEVHDIAFDGQFIYAATAGGLYKADVHHPNLLDYNAWQHLANLPDPDIEYRYVVYFNHKMFTIYQREISGDDAIITFSDSGWEIWDKSYSDRFEFLDEQQGYLVFSSLLRTKVYDGNEEAVRDVLTYYAKHGLYDTRHVLWYADPFNGLIKLDATGNGTIYFPDGPDYREVGDIEIRSGKLWAGGGTDASKWAGYGAYSFINEKWESYNSNTIPELSEFLNISEISIDPLDMGHIIGGSYGYGIAEFQDGQLIDIMDETDGILQAVEGYGHGYMRVTGTDFAKDRTLWISTSNTTQAVYSRKINSEMEAVPLDYNGFGITTKVGEILAGSDGKIWLLIENKGILVFKENSGQQFDERFFVAKNQTGELLDQVFTIAEDKEGDIWVGTDKGPVIYYSTHDIFDEENITGYQPEIPRNDETQFVDLLLSTAKINDIAVDGADQKWLATEKSGVFLVSSDGKKEIQHFTEENSPLLSNNVQTVAVNDKTGEVFFGTDKGMISFRGRATEGGSDFGKVYVFPNPVREHYYGDITVTGLAANVNVKIADISGNIVFETTALGGQAIWDGKNFRGQRVQTGIYLVFCTNDDGSQTFVTKLLFIH